jgi:hypothetical protein
MDFACLSTSSYFLAPQQTFSLVVTTFDKPSNKGGKWAYLALVAVLGLEASEGLFGTENDFKHSIYALFALEIIDLNIFTLILLHFLQNNNKKLSLFVLMLG